jgi:hypothetical protein
VREALIVNNRYYPDYYKITINGEHFNETTGRLWKERWDLINDSIDLTGLRVLDLGTNIGLLPIFAMRYGGAQSAVGVDLTFTKRFKLLAEAFEVEAKFIAANFKNPNYEKKIGFDYDIVFCLSVFRWIKGPGNQDRLLNYLAQFDRVIYEGHDSLEKELNRFKPFGYKHKIIGTSHKAPWIKRRPRNLIYFYRD